MFRAIGTEHVEGDVILKAAVDKQGTSVYRERYLDNPEDTFQFAPERFTGLAVITRRQLPPAYETAGGIAWETIAVDDPDYADDQSRTPRPAHAEIRFRRITDRPDPTNQRLKGAAKAAMLERLAHRMRIAIRPSS